MSRSLAGTYRAAYRIGLTPWQTNEVPAVLRGVITGRPPGRALDIGCGVGVSSAYLAESGWTVTGIDLVPRAIAAARARDPRVEWIAADITRWSASPRALALQGAVDLVLDDRCLHGLRDDERRGWGLAVNRVAAADALVLVAGAPSSARRVGPRGVDGDALASALGRGWTVLAPPDRGWHLLRRDGA